MLINQLHNVVHEESWSW